MNKYFIVILKEPRVPVHKEGIATAALRGSLIIAQAGALRECPH